MKLEAKVQAGSKVSTRQLQMEADGADRAEGGRLRITVDGQARKDADWCEVSPGVYSLIIAGRSYEARVAPQPADAAARGATVYQVRFGSEEYLVEIRDPRFRRPAGADAAHEGPQELRAPMPGRIVKVLVAEGEKVTAGQGLLVIEAMKMQNELRAPRAARVERIFIAEGAGVETGSKLMRLA
jgi:biotin carboxyl carrier protein